jgi:hypothetical protein
MDIEDGRVCVCLGCMEIKDRNCVGCLDVINEKLVVCMDISGIKCFCVYLDGNFVHRTCRH